MGSEHGSGRGVALRRKPGEEWECLEPRTLHPHSRLWPDSCCSQANTKKLVGVGGCAQ